MKRKAIIIGVNDYDDKNITPLHYAISDANRLSGLLANLPGGDFSVAFLPNPLAEDIMDELEKTASELSAGDLFFFYFAGHGLQPRGSGQHLLLCRNARRAVLQGHGTNGSVPHTFLDDITKQCPADMVFCFDACRTSVQHDRNAAAQMTGSAALRDIGVGTSKSARGARLRILSCSDGESAEENVELGGGIFTLSLVSHMKSCVIANQSIIFDTDLMNSVAAQMQQHRTIGTQTPNYNFSAGKTLVLFHGTKQKAEEERRRREELVSKTEAERLAKEKQDREEAARRAGQGRKSKDDCDDVPPLPVPECTGQREWYIFKVQVNSETSIRDALLRRVAAAGMGPFVGEVVIPTEKVTEIHGDKKHVAERNIYPGYLIISMELTEELWYIVRTTFGISDFTSSGEKPLPMLSHEVEKLLGAFAPTGQYFSNRR